MKLIIVQYFIAVLETKQSRDAITGDFESVRVLFELKKKKPVPYLQVLQACICSFTLHKYIWLHQIVSASETKHSLPNSAASLFINRILYVYKRITGMTIRVIIFRSVWLCGKEIKLKKKKTDAVPLVVMQQQKVKVRYGYPSLNNKSEIWLQLMDYHLQRIIPKFMLKILAKLTKMYSQCVFVIILNV